jgi:hypothetical protein
VRAHENYLISEPSYSNRTRRRISHVGGACREGFGITEDCGARRATRLDGMQNLLLLGRGRGGHLATCRFLDD